jgi:hypothetical protein
MATETNKLVMRRFTEFINTASEKLAAELISANARFCVPGRSEPLQGPTGHLAMIGIMRGGQGCRTVHDEGHAPGHVLWCSTNREEDRGAGYEFLSLLGPANRRRTWPTRSSWAVTTNRRATDVKATRSLAKRT